MDEHTNPGKKTGSLVLIAADTVRQFQKSWNWVFHPIQSFRRWISEVMEILAVKPTVDTARGIAPQPGQSIPEKEPVAQANVMQDAKTDTPSVEDTWMHIRDNLFKLAVDTGVNPAQVVPDIIAEIPEAHRAIISERLFELSKEARAKAMVTPEMMDK